MKAHEKCKETAKGEILCLIISSPTAKSNTLSQMLDSYSPPCYTANTQSEQAHARLRDCNIPELHNLFAFHEVRTGPRPIEGLQQWIELFLCSLCIQVRTGPRPIEGLQHIIY